MDREASSRQYVETLCAVLQNLPWDDWAHALRLFERAFVERRRQFIMGNGGGAATASHTANETCSEPVDLDTCDSSQLTRSNKGWMETDSGDYGSVHPRHPSVASGAQFGPDVDLTRPARGACSSLAQGIHHSQTCARHFTPERCWGR